MQLVYEMQHDVYLASDMLDEALSDKKTQKELKEPVQVIFDTVSAVYKQARGGRDEGAASNDKTSGEL
eukprot:gene21843-28873_t